MDVCTRASVIRVTPAGDKPASIGVTHLLA
jgi:hypothetical protein